MYTDSNFDRFGNLIDLASEPLDPLNCFQFDFIINGEVVSTTGKLTTIFELAKRLQVNGNLFVLTSAGNGRWDTHWYGVVTSHGRLNRGVTRADKIGLYHCYGFPSKEDWRTYWR